MRIYLANNVSLFSAAAVNDPFFGNNHTYDLYFINHNIYSPLENMSLISISLGKCNNCLIFYWYNYCGYNIFLEAFDCSVDQIKYKNTRIKKKKYFILDHSELILNITSKLFAYITFIIKYK